MAKKIKFPLQMKDDVAVRDLDELCEHFDLDKVIGCFLDGKLLSWCEARYYDAEADAIRALDKDDAGLHRRLCEIFGVEYHAEEAPKIDVEAVEERNRRLGELKQYTSDSAVLEKVDQVAFNQEELADLIDEGYSEIYLCNNSFVIPLRVRNKHYIGIGKAEAVIRSQERVEFEELGITFDDVKFDEAYEKLTHETPEELYRKGCEAEDRQDYTTALGYYQKVAGMGNHDAMFNVGFFYAQGYGVTQSYQEAIKWYRKSADFGNVVAMNMIGWLYEAGYGVGQNYLEAFNWYKKAADLGNTISMENIAFLYLAHSYEMGCEYAQRPYIALSWFKKAVEAGSNRAAAYIGWIYYYKHIYVIQDTLNTASDVLWYHNDLEAIKWFEKAADGGIAWAMNKLYCIYRDNPKLRDEVKSADWNQKAQEAGYSSSDFSHEYPNDDAPPRL